MQAIPVNGSAHDGIDGLRTALGVLNDYYGGGDKAYEGAGEESTGIIGSLEILRKSPRQRRLLLQM